MEWLPYINGEAIVEVTQSKFISTNFFLSTVNEGLLTDDERMLVWG